MLNRRTFITFFALGGFLARMRRTFLGTPAYRPAMFWQKKPAGSAKVSERNS